MRRMEEEKEAAEREKLKSLLGETSTVTEPSVKSPEAVSNPQSAEDKTEDKEIRVQAANPMDLQILKARLDAVEEKVREIELLKANDNSGTEKDQLSRKGVEEDTIKSQESVPQAAQTVPEKGEKEGLNSGSKAPRTVSHEDLKKNGNKENQRPPESRHEGNQEKKGGL